MCVGKHPVHGKIFSVGASRAPSSTRASGVDPTVAAPRGVHPVDHGSLRGSRLAREREKKKRR